ncbi:MAG: hypothetical protein ABSC94_05715 [Polyangiaceae bacterium]
MRTNQYRRPSLAWRILALAPVASLVWTTTVRTASAAGVIKVACIGEQTTHSDLYPGNTQDQPVGMQEYPAMLQTLLGSGYNVMNFGDCCASVISGYPTSETHPYINGNKFGPSVSFAPDIVIIGSWGRHDWGMSAQNALAAFKAGDTTTDFTLFQTDYDVLVSKYLAITPQPKIFCSTPIPIPFGNDGPDDGYKTSPAAAAVKAVCAKYNLPIIDMFTAFTGHMEYYINPPEKDSEGEHTSVAGMMETAQLVYDAITGSDAGGIVLDSDGGSTGTGGGASDASVGASSTGGATSGSGSASSDTSTSSSTSAVSVVVSTAASTSAVFTTSETSSSSSSASSADSVVSDSSAAEGPSDSGSKGGCSVAGAAGAGRTPWSVALPLVGLALVWRRRNRRAPPGRAL